MLNKVRLVALVEGTSKQGKRYFRALFKSKLPDGSPVTREYFLPLSVGDDCKKNGLVEDVDVVVEAGFNQFLGLEILEIRPADDERSVF